MITLIWAQDRNGGIGYKNKIPWRLPADMKFFKEQTIGKTVVMGRKTFESIGKPLPGRENVVVTSQKDFQSEGVVVFNSVREAFDYVKVKNAFIIGGESIYKQFLPYADCLIQTVIEQDFEVDTYAPFIDLSVWVADIPQPGIVDENNIYEHYFMYYER